MSPAPAWFRFPLARSLAKPAPTKAYNCDASSPACLLFKLFCCQIVRSLNALHFRICDVSSESTSIESFTDRYAGAWLQLSESFSGHNSMATEIVAIVCAIAVSRRERFTSRERVRQTVACRQAFACSVFVRFHFKSESAQQRRCRFGKLQAEPLHSRSASSHAASDCRSDTPGWTRLCIRRYRFVARSRRCRARAAAGSPGIMM